MKKIFSLLLVLSMLFTTPFCYANGAEEVVIPTYENEIDELKTIGILKDTFDPMKVTTRGEFTKLLISLAGLENLGVYGNNVYFYDVPTESEYFSSVAYCVEKGYVSGYPDGLFRPNTGITPEEAIKVLVHLLGYEHLTQGGFAEYITTAQMIGLTKGIDLPYGEMLLGGEVAKLIHNALDIPLVLMTGLDGENGVYEISEDKTILSENFGMGKMSGVVYATSLTGFSGHSAVSEKYAVIGNGSFYSETDAAWEYLGYNVDVLYSVNKEKDRNEILTININNKNKVIEISKEDFSKISDGKLYYTQNEKDVNISVTRFFNFIYNGKAQEYDSSKISNAKNGRFTLISNDGSNEYKIVKFESFTTFFVERVEIENETIYSEKSALELKKDEKDIVIKDKNQTRISLSDIKVYDVVSYYVNGDYIFMYVNTESSVITPSSINTADKTFEADGKTYNFAGDVYDNLKKYLSLNKSYKVYLDIFGNAANLEVVDGTEGEIVLSYGVENGSGVMDDDIFIIAFSLNTMKKERIQVRNNVTVNGTLKRDVERSYLKQELVKGQPFVIRKNEEGLITHIETARAASAFSDGQDGFTSLFLNDSGNHYTTKAYYLRYPGSFNNQVYLDADTKILVMPSDFNNAEEKDFILGEMFKNNRSKITVSAYSFSKDSVYADLIIMPYDTYFAKDSEDNSKCAVILDKRQAVDETGTFVTKINYMCENKESFIYAYTDMEASNYAVKISALQKGDIINITKDSDNRLLAYDIVLDNNSDKSKVVFKGSNTYYDPYIAHYGIYYADIDDIKGEFLKLKFVSGSFAKDPTTTDGKTINGGMIYQRYQDLPVTVISISGSVCKVEEGGFSDLVKDARIIYSTYAGEANAIIVLK